MVSSYFSHFRRSFADLKTLFPIVIQSNEFADDIDTFRSQDSSSGTSLLSISNFYR